MQDVTLLYYLKVWNAKLAGSPAVGDGAGAFATVFADVAGLPANLRMRTMLREIGFLLPRASGNGVALAPRALRRCNLQRM